MIDPNTADVTARVLEMIGRLRVQGKDNILHPSQIDRALAYLRREQEPEGCWFGRWGVNYIYGTSGVLTALSLVAPKLHRHIQDGAAWLVSCQNPDGGWGETCRSYDDPSLKGKGKSTASQTAWALIGLIAAGEATGKFEHETIERGVTYLLNAQQPDGIWNEPEFTGTGFPGHFYIKYHLYQQHFPLTALGRYRAILNQ
jgi:squalene-hopene/tetraprenyl-beta-curcumene cyclase